MSREIDRKSRTSTESAASSGSAGSNGKVSGEDGAVAVNDQQASFKNRRQGHRAAIKQKKIEEIHGHKFAKVFFKSFTFCSFCNSFIWGVTSAQGYRCQLCNKAVHKRCRKDIVDICTKSAKTSAHSVAIRERFNVNLPHKNSEVTVRTPTFCDHCGNMFRLFSKGKKCTECKCYFHLKCEALIDNTCGLNTKMMVEAIRETRRLSVSSQPPQTVESVFADIKGLSDRKYGPADFRFTKVLGKGSFGKVLLATQADDISQYFAIKVMRKDVALDDDDIETAIMERKVLVLGCESPFLTNLYCTFQSMTHLFFVMEYLNGGDLLFHIQRAGTFSVDRARFYCAEIISGLSFLHFRDIVYRDLKLDNVMLGSDGHIMLADFGMCRALKGSEKATTFCGTPDYIAPEIILGKKYNKSVDFWALGVLIYEMLIGNSPFFGNTDDELFDAVLKMDPMIPRFLDNNAKTFIKELLVRDPASRLGMTRVPIQQHNFFKGINWQKVESKELKPPFKPELRCPEDTKYFDSDMLSEPVKLTPVDTDIVKGIVQDLFKGFSFTSQYPFSSQQ